MERIQNINPDRLRWCCAEQGLAVEGLALAAGVPPNGLQKALKGEAGLTINQLRKIAEFFGRGVLFFLESGTVTAEQVHTPQFRTLRNQKPNLSPKIRRLVENVERQREVYLTLVEDLEDSPVAPFATPELPDNSVIRSASIARDWLGLDQQNEFSQYRAAVESKGILVFCSNGFAGKWQIPKDDPICGFALNHPVCPVIFVKKQAATVRQTFTLMHELGHLLVHRDSFIDNDDDLYSRLGKERDANAFAGNLLVPDHFLDQVNSASQPREVAEFGDWLTPIKIRLGVSTEVVLRRLLDAGRLDEKTYKAYRNWRASLKPRESSGGSRAYRFREPVHVFGDNFVRTVLDSLHSRNITLSKASGYLDNLKIAYVRKLESVYAND